MYFWIWEYIPDWPVWYVNLHIKLDNLIYIFRFSNAYQIRYTLLDLEVYSELANEDEIGDDGEDNGNSSVRKRKKN